MNILKYFTEEARDARTCRNDNRRKEILVGRAEKAINTTYVANAIWITIEGVPTFRVTNDSDVAKRTIAISQVELFIKDLRENWVRAHINDRLDQRA